MCVYAYASVLSLRLLSLLYVPVNLFLLLLLLLISLSLTDQELLGRPAQLSALHLALGRLHHDGWKAVLQLAAALEV